MSLSKEEMTRLQSEYATRSALLRVAEGTHHFQGPASSARTTSRNREKIDNGTHPFLDLIFRQQTAIRLKENNAQRMRLDTHNFLDRDWRKRTIAAQLQKGKHPFQNKEAAKERAARLFAEGKHNNQQSHTCPHCGKNGVGPSMLRWHFTNCKDIRNRR